MYEGEDDDDMFFMDTTTSAWSGTKTSFKYGNLVLMFFHQLFWEPIANLIIVRSHRDDEEDEWITERAQERQEDAHIKVEVQSNSEFSSLTLSPTRSPWPPWLQIDVQDAYKIGFERSTYARKEYEMKFPMEPVPCPNKMGFNKNCWYNLNI
jgi:hypothetical protein